MSRQSELLRRLRGLPAERREEFLAQLDGVTQGTRSAPLSCRQEQLWLFDRVAPSGKAYGLGFVLTLTGPLDAAALEDAVNDVVARHAVLRSVFPHEHETGAQVVQSPPRVRLPVEEPAEPGPDGPVRQVVRAELSRGFDVNADLMVRFRLLRRSEREHQLVVVTHYLVMDPRSTGVLCADLAVAYRARCAGRAPEFGTPAVDFGDYATWQREWSRGGDADRMVGYWQRTLGGWEDTAFPTDLPRPRLLDLDGGVVREPLAARSAERVREVARDLEVSPEDVLLAAYVATVARHTATTDVVIGVPHDILGPFSPDALIGDCGNLLPLRVEVDTGASFADLVRTVSRRRTEAEQHGDLPFKLVLERLGVEPDPSRLPLVQLGFTAAPMAAEPVRAGDLRIDAEQVDTGVGTFELSLEAALDGPAPTVAVRYAAALYREPTARRVAQRYLRLLDGGCRAPERPVTALPFGEPGAQDRILGEWNEPIGSCPDDTVHGLFERVARAYPDRLAVAFRKGGTTYAELDAWANRIARGLLDQGVRPDARVLVMVERGPALIAALLGVLKAGAAYVPVDLTLPEERVNAIAEDSGAGWALVSPGSPRPATEGVRTVDVEEDVTGLPGTSVDAWAVPESLAYVIYTSGSTGRPKGVLIEHRNVTNFIRTVGEMFGLGPDDRILQFASPGFDVSVFEVFGALLTGARLYVVDEEERRSVDALDALLVEQRITVVDLPPAIMELLEPERYEDLRVAFVGGEAFTGELTTRWARGRAFYNGYGPTETTVTVVARRCEGQWTSSPPIGRAMAHHRAYVLDADLGLQPPGAVGELAIAGLGVGRGYLGRPDLGAERFRPDPYGPPGSRMYLTGDLAVWDDDGDLRFLGRIDRQVKVRGVRIELGDVEAALQTVAGVARAVADVAVDPRLGTLLIAYVVPEDGADLQLDAVRAALGTRLPQTMVPNVLVPLDEVPLTQSGKVDRRALPAVEFAGVEDEADVDDEHSTSTERLVRGEVFAPLLGVRIGNAANFFAAGGTSLQAIRIASRVKAVFGVDVPIADFFADPTVGGLARLVDEATERDRERRGALAEALDLVEGRTDEEIGELARLLETSEGDG